MLDLRITNGQIVDGTGAARRGGDIGVRDGRVVALGEVDEQAKRTIDADGAIVAPGFIDVHTHYDAQVLWDATLAPSTLHGVTSVIGGNCGFSVAPLTPEGAPYLLRMLARVEGMPLSALEQAVDWSWSSTADYLGRIDGNVGPNIGFLVGHTALRRAVMGEAAKEREAAPEELAAMEDLLAAGLDAGGLGFSSSLGASHNDAEGDPVPSRWASHDEVLALAQVCAKFPGTHLELVPHTGPDPFPAAIEDLLVELTVRTGRPLNWNIVHADAHNRDEVESKLAVSDRAARAGGRVVGLFMPMPIRTVLNFLSGFVLDMLEGWSKPMALPPAEKLALLASPDGRAQLRQLAESRPFRYSDWAGYEIIQTFASVNRAYEGRRVGGIAAAEGKHPYDVLLDIVVADELRTTFAFPPRGTDKADWAARGEVLRDQRVVVGASDAGAHLDMIDTFRYTTSLLEDCVRQHGLLSTEGAVHLITRVPAELLGLEGRGMLAEGSWADVVIFDEGTVGSGPLETRADLPGGGLRLFAESTGISHVVVNGETIVERGSPTGQRPGRVLRSGRDTRSARLHP